MHPDLPCLAPQAWPCPTHSLFWTPWNFSCPIPHPLCHSRSSGSHSQHLMEKDPFSPTSGSLPEYADPSLIFLQHLISGWYVCVFPPLNKFPSKLLRPLFPPNISIYNSALTPAFRFKRHSVVSNFLRPHGQRSLAGYSLRDSPGKNTEVGCHFLLQGIFPTQGLNPGLLYCKQILYHLNHWRSPVPSSQVNVCAF